MTDRHDLIGIGGSAGAFPAIRELLGNAELSNASVFIVIHRGNDQDRMVELLKASTSQKLCEPKDGEKVVRGSIYLAPSDYHMLVSADHIHLRRGPRENNFRPSIDSLFRSLAVFGSTRSIAIILSGYLDDGAAGSISIQECGGVTIVQDPAEAFAPDMPRAVISALGEPDIVAPVEEIGKGLSKWISAPAGDPIAPSSKVMHELMIAGLEEASMETEEKIGELSPFNCPDCNGVLWEIESEKLLRYRCHTGHAYTANALVEAQNESLEKSLYEALRGQRERAELLRRMAKRDNKNTKRWIERAEEYEEDAELLERALLRRTNPQDSMQRA